MGQVTEISRQQTLEFLEKKKKKRRRQTSGNGTAPCRCWTLGGADAKTQPELRCSPPPPFSLSTPAVGTRRHHVDIQPRDGRLVPRALAAAPPLRKPRSRRRIASSPCAITRTRQVKMPTLPKLRRGSTRSTSPTRRSWTRPRVHVQCSATHKTPRSASGNKSTKADGARWPTSWNAASKKRCAVGKMPTGAARERAAKIMELQAESRRLVKRKQDEIDAKARQKYEASADKRRKDEELAKAEREPELHALDKTVRIQFPRNSAVLSGWNAPRVYRTAGGAAVVAAGQCTGKPVWRAGASAVPASVGRQEA
ncbi:hypothetical protein L1887_40470 [Cichorium endivia]|nr:hypothetical protein L1887_40470 [Cichorium endivia]